MTEFTPVERYGAIRVKRDDLYTYAGINGGKVRTCRTLAEGAKGLVTAGSRMSPQCNIVASVAKEMGLPAIVHTPTGELGPEVINAQAKGATVVQHRPGYNSVIIKRARDCAEDMGYTEIPFGMECQAAVDATAEQVANLPFDDFDRIVMPVGSGMSLAGVLWGLKHYAPREIPILGVSVGASAEKRLDKYAPKDWRGNVTLVQPGVDYHKGIDARIGELVLDPIYEAKCTKYLEPGDLFWIVGIRETL